MLLRERLGPEGLDALVPEDGEDLSATKETLSFIYEYEEELPEQGIGHVGLYFIGESLHATNPHGLGELYALAKRERITYALIYPLNYAELLVADRTCSCCDKSFGPTQH